MQERYYECSGSGNFSLLNSSFVPHWGVWVLDMLCQSPGVVSSAAQGTVSSTRQEPQKGPFWKFRFGPNETLKTTWWLCFFFPLATKEDVSQSEWRLLKMIVQLWILDRSVESFTQPFSGGSFAVQYARKDQHQSLLRRWEETFMYVRGFWWCQGLLTGTLHWVPVYFISE